MATSASSLGDGTVATSAKQDQIIASLQSIDQENGYLRVTGNGTTLAKSGAGVLHGVIINNAATNGNLVLYDSLTAVGTVICNLNVGTAAGGLLSTNGFPNPTFIGPLALQFNTGLTAVRANSNNNDFTLIFR